MKTQILKFIGLVMIMAFLSNSVKAIDVSRFSNDNRAKPEAEGFKKELNFQKVKIFDSKGAIVFDENAENSVEKESEYLGSLPDGYYTYQVIHGTELVYRAIITKNSDGQLSLNDLPGNASACISQKDQYLLVRIFKDENSRARVVIRDESNEVIYSRRTKKSGSRHITHDISKLPEGKYNISVYNNGVLAAEKLFVK
jgi:hypothetical protein